MIKVASRQPVVAGNWKLNGSRASVAELAGAVVSGAADVSCDIVLCPTSVHIPDVMPIVSASSVSLGAQNCAAASNGAFTGEVSPTMLTEFGCAYVILGHSERRALFGETSAQVALKMSAVLDASLTPILCVGETLEQREAGQLLAVLDEQLDAVVNHCGIKAFGNAIIAYEPVWAIGTGKTASPEQAQEVHALIRGKLSALDAGIANGVQILYGGSVKPDNANELFAQADIDGGLIGGAALDADSFLSICRAAA